MVCSMVDQCIMTQLSLYSGNIHCSYQNYEPHIIALQVSALMIEYLVATSYKLWMIQFVLYFVV